MPPVPIVFPSSSAPGMRLQESGGRLINAFAEKAPVGAPSQLIYRRSPGLVKRAMTGDPAHIHTRGFLDIGNLAFWIVNERLYLFDINYALNNIGELQGIDPVTTARNNKAPTPDNVVVTDLEVRTMTTGAPPALLVLPEGNPSSVCDYNGYFIFSYRNGKIFASDLNSTVVNSFSFNTEQGASVRRVARFAGRLYAFCDKWTGVYRDAGTSPFPLAREVTIPRGIVGTHAVAGWETGWANELLWVGDDFVVYKLNGYTPVPVSTDDVSRAVQDAVLNGDRNLIEAFVYMYGKAAFWVLNAHNRFTWEYNLTTGEWNERFSYNRPNWKGMKSIRIFDKWFIGDEYTGDLYTTSGTYFLEGLEPLIWHVESGIMHNFPLGVVIPRVSFNFTTAVGTGLGSRVEISWSLDGGFSYGLPIIRRTGGAGESKSHPYILNCGLSRGQGIRYRLRVSDPVHVGLSGGVIEVEPRSYSG